jgi:hypothetical protein
VQLHIASCRNSDYAVHVYTNRGVNNGGDTPPRILGRWDAYMRCPPRLWLIIDRNVKYILRISGDFVTKSHEDQLISTNQEVCSILLPFVISIVRDLMHWASLNPLLRDFAPRSELRRRIFEKFDWKKTCRHFTVWCNQWQIVYCVGDRQYLILFVSQNFVSISVVQGAKGVTVEVKAIKCLP